VQDASTAGAPELTGTAVPASPSATTVEEPLEPTEATVGTTGDGGSSTGDAEADLSTVDAGDAATSEPATDEATDEASTHVTTADAGVTADVPEEDEESTQDVVGDEGATEDGSISDLDRLENEGDIAADYLEELLDIADLDGDLDMDVEGDRAAVSIVGGDVRLLVGRDGEVLEALQELTRLAVYRETGERSRLMLDVGGFRADKRTRLERVAADAVAEVKASGERKALDPMTPFERKVVHDVVAASGLSSASEGQEPRRYVVVLPA
jgi:spoIIIJ-associated protein